MLNFITQLVVDVLSVKVIAKLGYRTSIVLAHVFSAVGLFLLGNLPRAMDNHYLGLVIPIIIYATGSGLIEVLVSPIVEGLPLQNKSGEMSLLHSFYCWGQMGVILISALVLAISDGKWRFIPVFSIIFIFRFKSCTKKQTNKQSFSPSMQLVLTKELILTTFYKYCIITGINNQTLHLSYSRIIELII